MRRKTAVVVRQRRKKPTLRSLDKKLKKITNDIESKHDDLFAANEQLPANPGPLVYCLDAIALGTESGERIGDEVIAKSVQLRLHMVGNPNVVTPTEVRIIMFWDRQSNGQSVFAISQLLDISTVTDPTHSPYNHAYNERYKILYDKRFVLRPTSAITGTTSIPDAKVLTIRRSFNRRVKYLADDADAASIATNQLMLVYLSSTTTNMPYVTTASRFYFRDA